MDQTKFDIYQSVLEVVSNMHLPESLRETKGEQFAVSLMAFRPNGEVAPIDIYVDRTPPGETSLKFKTSDGAQVLGATASIDPNGERFDIDIIVERHRDSSSTRPFIRVAPKMLQLLRERQAIRVDDAIRQIIDGADLSNK